MTMETLQGLSATALSSSAGRKWRTAYSDPANTERVGLDDTVWPEAFDRMEQFIQDTHLTAEDLNNNYDTVTELFQTGQPAMYFGSSAGVSLFREEGIDTVFLPFFGENGEKWLLTTPYFQVALNREIAVEILSKYGFIVDTAANAFEEDRKSALECGMNGFLSKPINIEELIAALSSLLAG